MELVEFEQHLTATLNDIFIDLNRMLDIYFSELRIKLSYVLQPLVFNYGHGKWQWNITSDLRLNVEKDGVLIDGDYSDLLNEARLSAFAICLYLASLKRNPQVDLQILYLDDIFIGLDAGNRLPILSLIESEFKNYQIFISTYDRHWYELAKRYFEIPDGSRWLSVEFYVGIHTVNTITFDKPTITTGASDFDRAVRYLHHRSNPDYPAAANYFRKSLEQLIQKYIPSYELTGAEYVHLPDYQLTQLLERTKEFLIKTANTVSTINTLISLLHGLIHPLSHYSINSPMYKNELVIIENAIRELQSKLASMDIANSFKCILEVNKKVKLIFCVDQSSNHYIMDP